MKKVLFVLVLFTLFVAQVQAQDKADCQVDWNQSEYIGYGQYLFTYHINNENSDNSDWVYSKGALVFNDTTQRVSLIKHVTDRYIENYSVSPDANTVAGLSWYTLGASDGFKISIYKDGVVAQIIDLSHDDVEYIQWTGEGSGFLVKSRDQGQGNKQKQFIHYVGLDKTRVLLLEKSYQETVLFDSTKDGTIYYLNQTEDDQAKGVATIYKLDISNNSQVVASIKSPLETRPFISMRINTTGEIFEFTVGSGRVFYDTRSMKLHVYPEIMGGDWIGHTWGYYRSVSYGDVDETEHLHTVDFTDPNNILEEDYLLKDSNWWFRWIDHDHIMSMTYNPQIINIRTDERRNLLNGFCPLN